jgi:thioredoxin reductase (NADPH)
MIDATVAIVGAGPIGVELAVSLKRQGLSHVHLEAGRLGETIASWPPGTRFLSEPEWIEIPGLPIDSRHQERPLGEEYLRYLRHVVARHDLDIHLHEPVTAIEPRDGGWTLQTTRSGQANRYVVRYLVLTTGDMAAPRRLAVPGEDLPHVQHRLGKPHDYFDRRVLVVGGANSAVEAVLRIHRIGGSVALACAEDHLPLELVSPKLQPGISELIDSNAIDFLPGKAVTEITRTGAMLADTQGRLTPDPEATSEEVPADVVLVQIGYEGDFSLFESAGGQFTAADGPPSYNPNTMETNLPGVYVAGTAVAGKQPGHAEFIQTSHIHVSRIVADILRRERA